MDEGGDDEVDADTMNGVTNDVGDMEDTNKEHHLFAMGFAGEFHNTKQMVSC